MRHTDLKNILIKFMEWQMETKPLIANFTHNYVANKFLEEYHKEIGIDKKLVTRSIMQNICDQRGIKLQFMTEEWCRNHDLYNHSSCAGVDEIFIGIYDDDECEFASFFHELGHCINTKKWDWECQYDWEKMMWTIGFDEAAKLSIYFSEKTIQWCQEQNDTYLGYEERENKCYTPETYKFSNQAIERLNNKKKLAK